MTCLHKVLAEIIGENKVLPKGLATFPLLFEAYRHTPEGTQLLTHTCEVNERGFPRKVLCGKAKLSSIADDLVVAEDELPTCPTCLQKIKKWKGGQGL